MSPQELQVQEKREAPLGILQLKGAHFAGALDTPTWALIPSGGEWRWQTSGDNCLWHRSVRLFRQQRFDDWTDVFTKLRDELAIRVNSDFGTRHGRAA